MAGRPGRDRLTGPDAARQSGRGAETGGEDGAGDPANLDDPDETDDGPFRRGLLLTHLGLIALLVVAGIVLVRAPESTDCCSVAILGVVAFGEAALVLVALVVGLVTGSVVTAILADALVAGPLVPVTIANLAEGSTGAFALLAIPIAVLAGAAAAVLAQAVRRRRAERIVAVILLGILTIILGPDLWGRLVPVALLAFVIVPVGTFRTPFVPSARGRAPAGAGATTRADAGHGRRGRSRRRPRGAPDAAAILHPAPGRDAGRPDDGPP